ncbi:MAG TPA: hypothetical protein PLN68_08060, partial [Elusimicrobiales bacterium]|nr:hypothetical protein [Elusimicrobiales bacterium]
MNYKYDDKGMMKNFIDGDKINYLIKNSNEPDLKELTDILEKSFSVCDALNIEEVARLMAVKSRDKWELVFSYAEKIKKKVYDNRIVVFAPLYASNICVNNCLYCGFR